MTPWSRFNHFKPSSDLLDGTEKHLIPLFFKSPIHQSFFHNYTLIPDSSTPTSQLLQHELHFTSTPSSTPSSTYTSTPSHPIQRLVTARQGLQSVILLIQYPYISLYIPHSIISLYTPSFLNSVYHGCLIDSVLIPSL